MQEKKPALNFKSFQSIIILVMKFTIKGERQV